MTSLNLAKIMSGNETFTVAKDCQKPREIEHASFREVCEKITSPPTKYVGLIDRIRMIARKGAKEGVDESRIKKAIKPLKLQLPVFITYKANYLGESPLAPNPFLQIDVDFEIIEGNDSHAYHCKDVMSDMVCFALVALSPSGFGVKAFIKATGDDDIIRQRLKTALHGRGVKGNFKLDNLSRKTDCFLPFDKDAYYDLSVRTFHYPEKQKATPPVSKNPNRHRPMADSSGVMAYALRKAFNIARYNQGGNILTHEGKRHYSSLCYQYGINSGDAWCYLCDKVTPDIPEKEFLRRWGAMELNDKMKAKRAILVSEIEKEYLQMLERQRNYVPR